MEEYLRKAILRIGERQNVKIGRSEYCYIPSSEMMLKSFIEFLRKNKIKMDLVDVGCGTGAFIYLAGLYTKLNATGIEKDPIRTKLGIVSFCPIQTVDVFSIKTKFRTKKVFYLFNPVVEKELMSRMLSHVASIARKGSIIVFASTSGEHEIEGWDKSKFEGLQIFKS